MSEKKSVTEKYDKGTDELVDTLLSEKKTSTKKLDKGTDEKVDTLLSDKNPLTKDVKKGTDELSFKFKKSAHHFHEGFKSI